SKVVAKTIARTGIAPLYKIIYEVCKQEGLIVRIPQQGQDGSTQFQEISASDWPDIYDFVVDINTQRDVVAENDQIIGVVKEIAALSQIPLFANQTQYLFNVANKLGQQVGVDMTPFVPNPSAQPPDPQQAALQQKLQEMEIQFKQFTIEEQEQKVNKLVAEINKLEAEVEEKLR
ncbi:portal protein, partial [Herbiconiux daphne]